MSAGSHAHEHDHGPRGHSHGAGGHSHGLVHESIKRSREGVRVVLVALLVLGLTAAAQGAIVVALGLRIADPLIGLAITLVILRITRDSWRTIRQGRR